MVSLPPVSVKASSSPPPPQLPSISSLSSSNTGWRRRRRSAPVRTSQTTAEPSYEAEIATCGSVGWHLSTYTSRACAASRPSPPSSRSAAPVRPHQTKILASEREVTRSESSADHATAPITGSTGLGLATVHGVSPSRVDPQRSPGYETSVAVLPRTCPFPARPFRRHNLAVPSLEPDRSASPLLDQLMLVTSCRWPRRVATSCGTPEAQGVVEGGGTRYTCTTSSVVPTAKRVPPGLHAPSKTKKPSADLTGVRVDTVNQPSVTAPVIAGGADVSEAVRSSA
eukprot:scaffold270140_cov30-Tisochrysis_lutea.AAC.2